MIRLLLAVNLGALVVYFQLSSFCPRHVKHKYENTEDQSKQLVIMIAVALFIENILLHFITQQHNIDHEAIWRCLTQLRISVHLSKYSVKPSDDFDRKNQREGCFWFPIKGSDLRG